MSEAGSGYKPKLVVTYTEGEAKTSSDSGAGTEVADGRQIEAVEQGAGTEGSLAATAIMSGDEGSGTDIGGLLQDLFDLDGGSGAEEFKALTQKGGAETKLRSNRGQVGLPNKEVSL
jgi:hypothetical protein